MPSLIPDTHRDLLDQPIYVALTTVMPDGQPQSTVVWVDYDGEYVLVNTARGRQKDKNLRENPRVTVLSVDPQNPFRWLEVRGVVESMTEEGAAAHINRLAHKYAGKDYYGGVTPAEQAERETRVMVRIKPTKVLAFPPAG
jgi:PPOX class probable F420-dependent enzyme